VSAGITLGAHTCSHPKLIDIPEEQAQQELNNSKRIIEERLQVPCHHFAATWGHPDKDYDTKVHPQLAQQLGFHSFLTTERGLMRAGDNPYRIRRDALLAYESNAVIKYFLR
jgi:peptidoglycan/xylan/chitin deacetylase (PgdA/CDA1 family)